MHAAVREDTVYFILVLDFKLPGFPHRRAPGSEPAQPILAAVDPVLWTPLSTTVYLRSKVTEEEALPMDGVACPEGLP